MPRCAEAGQAPKSAWLVHSLSGGTIHRDISSIAGEASERWIPRPKEPSGRRLIRMAKRLDAPTAGLDLSHSRDVPKLRVQYG